MRHVLRSIIGHLTPLVLVVGLTWATIGFNLWHEYSSAVRDAENDTTNFARAFVENITRTIAAVDLTLLFMRDVYQHDPVGLASGAWASRSDSSDDPRSRMVMTDSDGNVVWSNMKSGPAAVNIADREHFQIQKTSSDDTLVIGKPVVGRVAGYWIVPVSRKLLAPDGSFAGVAVVGLDPRSLSSFYESLSIGDGSIIIGTVSGTILARVPNNESLVGKDLPPGIVGRIKLGTIGASYRIVSSLDHVERIYSSRRLDRYPLVVAVGLATEDVFAAYDRNKRLYVAIGILLTAASIAVALILARQRRSLVNSRQALTVTLENISQGITMVDAGGKVQVLNQRAIDLLGLPPELLATSPVYRQILEWQIAQGEFCNERTPAESIAGIYPGPTGLPRGNHIYERTRPDGSVLEIRTQSLPDGGIVRTFTDITERQQNELALSAAQARAAHAERIQALGQLAGGIAHDFNNILQAVQGGAGLIDKRAAEPDKVRQFARMILNATERGTSITGRLLAFARRGELQAEPVEPAGLLFGLREVLSHTLGVLITVKVHVKPGLPLLLTDKNQLETVLVNLATNARDAMPSGGTLVFSASSQTVDANSSMTGRLQLGRYILISIADTGNGMDEATLAQAQEPFFSTKPAGQGTGLGLSMAKRFLEQSGGTLSIDSLPNRGTTIHLWLPATAQSEAAAAPTQPIVFRPDESAKRILLVDDEAMVRETLAMSLEDIGYTVLMAADGLEALDMLTAGANVDVLVTDLSMPVLDGLALIRKARSERPDMPAVLVTGFAGPGTQLAMNEFLTGTVTLMRKPVTAAQLDREIEALLRVTEPG